MPIMGVRVDSFMDSLLSAVRFSCCGAVFLGTAHKTRRKLYMEIFPAMGSIFPCTCPSKRSTASIIALSTWNVVTSPRFMTKHSLCHCSRVEKALTALTYGHLSTAVPSHCPFVSIWGKVVLSAAHDAELPCKEGLYLWYFCSSSSAFLAALSQSFAL